MVVGKFKTHPKAKKVGKGKGRQPAPEVKQDDLEDQLVAYVKKNGANSAFDFKVYKSVPKTAAVRGSALLRLKSLFLTLLAVNPTLMFTNNILKRALTNVAMQFEELRDTLPNLDSWSGKTSERLQVIMAHWRRLQNSEVRLRQASRTLDDAATAELTKLAKMIQPCAYEVLHEVEHSGKAEEVEQSEVALVARDSGADITPEDSISNRDPMSPTPVKKKLKTPTPVKKKLKTPTPVKKKLKKSPSVKGAAAVMEPVCAKKKMKRPAAATVGDEFPKIFLTKANDRTYLQVQEKKGSAKKHLINVHQGMSSNHLKIVTLIKQTMEEIRRFDKATAVDLREELLKPRSG